MKRDDEDLEAYWEQRAMMDSLDDGDPWEIHQDDSDDFDGEVIIDDDDEECFDEDSLEWDNPDEDY